MSKKEELIALYHKNSKHSNYQIIPNALKEILGTDEVEVLSRIEKERMDYLKSQIDFADKRVLDIGGNTGYFTFESIDAGAKEVVYIEGNKQHAEFVALAADTLSKNIKAENRYLNFAEGDLQGEQFDVVLLFNVIHHFGDDFGDQEASVSQAKEKMKEAINFFTDKTDTLVMQMGFCWKGDRNLLLFENGTKSEMIDFVKEATNGKWEVKSIGVAEERDGAIVYADPTPENLQRSDAMGEFKNRPIFILKPKA